MASYHLDRLRRRGPDGTEYQTATDLAASATGTGGFRKATLTLATGGGAAGTFSLTVANSNGLGTAVAAAQQYAVELHESTAAGPPVVVREDDATGITPSTGTVQVVGSINLVTTAAAGTFVGSVAGLTAGTLYYVVAYPIGTYGVPVVGTVTTHA